jgi:hypothetical protein
LIALDHIVVAARTLDEGVAWVESRLGVAMGQGGGKHPLMGTHNRVMSLGPGRFLEVLAIDPDAPPPSRPRWFDLDAPAMRERLGKGPALVNWAVRTDDIGRTVAAIPGERPEIVAASRGELRWKIGVPADGSLAQQGVVPTVIQWQGRGAADLLPASPCRLEMLVLRHAQAPATLRSLRRAGLAADEPVEAHHEGHGLEARVRTPHGLAGLTGITPLRGCSYNRWTTS